MALKVFKTVSDKGATIRICDSLTWRNEAKKAARRGETVIIDGIGYEIVKEVDFKYEEPTGRIFKYRYLNYGKINQMKEEIVLFPWEET